MRHYLERRVNADGTVSYRCRYEALGADGRVRLCSETVRQAPGESERALRRRAEQRLAELVADAGRGLIAAPAALSVRELLDRYLASRRDLAPSSHYAYRQVVATLPATLLAARVDRVTGLDVEAALGALATAGYTARVDLARALLSGAFAAAVRWGLRTRSPVGRGTVRVGARRVPRAWTAEEAGRFLAVADADPDAALWRLLLLGGLRLGEALALTWSDLDLDAGTVTIRRTVTRTREGRWTIGERAKRPRSHRTVSLTPATVAALRAHRDRLRFAGAAGPGDLVFPGRNGARRHKLVWQRLGRLCRAAGVPRLTPHGLRHTSATLDLAAGTPPQVVAARLGISIAVLLSTYAHVLPGAQREAVAALEASLARATDVVAPSPEKLGKSGH